MNNRPPEEWTDAEQVRFLAVEAFGYKPFGEMGGIAFWVDGVPKVVDPLTSGDDMLAVIRAMHGKNFVITILFGFGDEPCLVTIEKWIGAQVSVHSNADTPHRAVCIAAIKALIAIGAGA